MRVSTMKNLLRGFSLKAFVIAVTVSAVVAGLIAWFTHANFWYVLLIVMCGLLINGWIASAEDRDVSESEKH